MDLLLQRYNVSIGEFLSFYRCFVSEKQKQIWDRIKKHEGPLCISSDKSARTTGVSVEEASPSGDTLQITTKLGMDHSRSDRDGGLVILGHWRPVRKKVKHQRIDVDLRPRLSCNIYSYETLDQQPVPGRC